MRLIIILFILIGACRANPGIIAKPKEMAARMPQITKPQDEIWVMIIDTGIGRHDKLTNVEYIDADDYVDTYGHGTHVAGIVQYGNGINKTPGKIDFGDSLCKNVKLFSCKYYERTRPLEDPVANAIRCIGKATELKMDYINYSAGGKDFSVKEYDAYKKFTDTGGTVVVAAGNEASRLEDKPYYPASYAFNNGFTSKQRSELRKDGTRRFVPLRLQVVQNVFPDHTYVPSSNTDPLATFEVGYNILSTLPNNTYGIMTGTSQASPAVLHTILKQECSRLNGKK